jgi:uncharacterized damage-inducible protein DinB
MVSERFIAQAREYLGVEYRTKIRLAVELLSTEQLWWHPNEASNSVGNLLLHLAGNVRQWIVSGVGGAADTRRRAAEFAARDGSHAHELLAALDATLDEVDAVLATLTPAVLMERRHIQGRDLVVLDAVFHVVEHFSYHVGQIVLVTKMLAPDSVKFYEDAGGLARPAWKDSVRNWELGTGNWELGLRRNPFPPGPRIR